MLHTCKDLVECVDNESTVHLFPIFSTGLLFYYHRWNHTGFMELYPDEFLSRQSMDELSNGEGEDGIKKKVKKKRRKRYGTDWSQTWIKLVTC